MPKFKLLVINESNQQNPELLQTLDFQQMEHTEILASSDIENSILDIKPDLILYECKNQQQAAEYNDLLFSFAQHPDIPVIIIGNIQMLENNFDNLLNQNYTFIPKPYHALDLIGKIHSAIYVKLRKSLLHAARN